MRDFLFYAVGLLVLWACLIAYRADAARQKAVRTTLTTLSQASRARRLSECPPEFLRRLEATMRLSDNEEVA